MSDKPIAPREYAPVQGNIDRIPWSMHLRAYEAYCKKWAPQPALLEGHCRGGFHTDELDVLIPGWRDDLSALLHPELKGEDK